MLLCLKNEGNDWSTFTTDILLKVRRGGPDSFPFFVSEGGGGLHSLDRQNSHQSLGYVLQVQV